MHTLQQLKNGELKGVKELRLSEGLTEFPTEIFDLADSLELLDLSGNKLHSLPAEFCKLSKLKIAFFSDNLFTEFPKEMAACKELEMIGFKSNQITTVSEGVFPEKLRWLILTNNQIQSIPKSIGKCYRLQKVAFAGNCLTELPAEMAQCKNLELLRTSANQLNEFPSWLLSLPKLTWLAVSGNTYNSKHTIHNTLPKIHWSDLELHNVLGTGASGIISKAKWITAGKEVAVKVFKGEVTSDGLPHDEMLACIEAGNHDNLVKVIGQLANHPDGKEGLVLELIPNEYSNLGLPPSFVTCTRDTFKDGTQFSLTTILNTAKGVASAMKQLHERCIMHGDLYAHNILIDQHANPLLGDFGAATIYDEKNEQTLLFEKLDVRAFGCLLDDMLQQIVNEDKSGERFKAISLIREECMTERIELRPDFEELDKRLQQL